MRLRAPVSLQSRLQFLERCKVRTAIMVRHNPIGRPLVRRFNFKVPLRKALPANRFSWRRTGLA